MEVSTLNHAQGGPPTQLDQYYLVLEQSQSVSLLILQPIKNENDD